MSGKSGKVGGPFVPSLSMMGEEVSGWFTVRSPHWGGSVAARLTRGNFRHGIMGGPGWKQPFKLSNFVILATIPQSYLL